jgi:hypothetical protein
VLLNLAVLLVCHFIADFVLQSREMGKNKSSNFSVLCQHITIQFYVILFGLAVVPGLSLEQAFLVALFNALVHGLIDWNIWRGYKQCVYFRIKKNNSHPLIIRSALADVDDTKNGWMYWEDHYFYLTIGLDQLLHGLTLIALAGLLL